MAQSSAHNLQRLNRADYHPLDPGQALKQLVFLAADIENPLFLLRNDSRDL
jgi:hypothetical protein